MKVGKYHFMEVGTLNLSHCKSVADPELQPMSPDSGESLSYIKQVKCSSLSPCCCY